MDSEPEGHPQIHWMMSNDIESVMSIEQDEISGSWSSARFRTELAQSTARYIILHGASAISAFAGLWIRVDEARIVTMAVRAAERRRGYGGLILRGLLGVAADLGLSTATLECRSGNDAARALYRKFGFFEVGERRSYYADGEDAVVMATEEFESAAYRARLAKLDGEIQRRFPGVATMPPGPRPLLRME